MSAFADVIGRVDDSTRQRGRSLESIDWSGASFFGRHFFNLEWIGGLIENPRAGGISISTPDEAADCMRLASTATVPRGRSKPTGQRHPREAARMRGRETQAVGQPSLVRGVLGVGALAQVYDAGDDEDPRGESSGDGPRPPAGC
jgi:hypothetical protein